MREFELATRYLRVRRSHTEPHDIPQRMLSLLIDVILSRVIIKNLYIWVTF